MLPIYQAVPRGRSRNTCQARQGETWIGCFGLTRAGFSSDPGNHHPKARAVPRRLEIVGQKAGFQRPAGDSLHRLGQDDANAIRGHPRQRAWPACRPWSSTARSACARDHRRDRHGRGVRHPAKPAPGDWPERSVQRVPGTRRYHRRRPQTARPAVSARHTRSIAAGKPLAAKSTGAGEKASAETVLTEDGPARHPGALRLGHQDGRRQ